jgi:serralysin
MATIYDIQTIPHSGLTSVDALLDDGPSWNYLLPLRTTIYYTFDTYNGIEADVSALSTFNTR